MDRWLVHPRALTYQVQVSCPKLVRDVWYWRHVAGTGCLVLTSCMVLPGYNHGSSDMSGTNSAMVLRALSAVPSTDLAV